MAGKYHPAEKLIARFPRFPKPKFVSVRGVATLECGCGETCFRIQKIPMELQRHTKEASHRKILAVCLNPKCGQEYRLDD